MGYACPVCGTEEVDAVHLANHLAITASLGRGGHLRWLETHAPDWRETGPEELGAAVAEHAPEVETPDFESGGGAAPSLEAELAAEGRRPGRGAMGNSVPGDVLEEARELTEEMERRRERAAETREDAGEGDGEPATGDDVDTENQ